MFDETLEIIHEVKPCVYVYEGCFQKKELPILLVDKEGGGFAIENFFVEIYD